MSHHYDLLSIYQSFKARIDSEIKRYDHQIRSCCDDLAVINFNKLTIFYQLYFLGDVFVENDDVELMRAPFAI